MSLTMARVRQDMLCRDIALPVIDPIDLSSSKLPVVSQYTLKLGLCQTGGQSPTDELQAWLSRFRTARCLCWSIFLEDCDGQYAVDAGGRCHYRVCMYE